MPVGSLELAQDLAGRAGKPAFLTFSREAKHLPAKSAKAGRYIAIDVDYVTVRQLGATDSTIFEVEPWLKQQYLEVQGGRLAPDHYDYYQKAYALWKQGQDLPIEGTPIKGWAVISPAQAETIIQFGIRTVEDLATINGEVQARIGMGAVMLKNKAMAWVAQAQDKGPLTMQMSALQQENDLLKANLTMLTERVEELAKMPPPVPMPTQPGAIEAADLLPAEDPPKRGPGRPRKES